MHIAQVSIVLSRSADCVFCVAPLIWAKKRSTAANEGWWSTALWAIANHAGISLRSDHHHCHKCCGSSFGGTSPSAGACCWSNSLNLGISITTALRLCEVNLWVQRHIVEYIKFHQKHNGLHPLAYTSSQVTETAQPHPEKLHGVDSKQKDP